MKLRLGGRGMHGNAVTVKPPVVWTCSCLGFLTRGREKTWRCREATKSWHTTTCTVAVQPCGVQASTPIHVWRTVMPPPTLALVQAPELVGAPL